MSARAWPPPPEGFVLHPEGKRALYVDVALEAEARALGLHALETWNRALVVGIPTSGRGVTAVLTGDSGVRWRVKAMRRGGRLAQIWCDRYPTARRLVETLSASAEARRRGVPTARPMALIVETGAGGLARGAMAVEEIVGSEDLARRVVRGAATREEVAAAIGAVRAMHDRGVLHPDLNLGNILLGPAPREISVIDFDRAKFASGPLPFAPRQAALRRLERSCAKLTGSSGPWGPGSEDFWYTAYSGDDAELLHRFTRGRPLGRLSLTVHRLGWRRRTS